MSDHNLRLFLVEFSHRLYRRKIDKRSGCHLWQYMTFLICRNNVPEVEDEITSTVNEFYKKYTYDLSGKTRQHSSEIKTHTIKEIELPEEISDEKK